MKKPSSDLFDLVHLLTKSEKRYLKVQAQGENKQHMYLLELLLQQDKYDEAILKGVYSQETKDRHFAASKQYLYEYILKHLYHLGGEDKQSQVKQGIAAVELLYKKGLFQQCHKQLLKWKKKAYAIEQYEQLIVLLKTEKALLSTSFGQHLAPTSGKRIFEEEQNCLAQLANINKYWLLNNEIFELQKRFQKIEAKDQVARIQEIEQNEQLNDLAQATTLLSKMYFFRANATFQFTLGHPERAYTFNEQFLSFLESDETFLRRLPNSYLSTLNNLLIDSLVLKKKQALTDGIQKLRSLPKLEAFKAVKNIEAQVFQQGYMLEINYCLSEGDFAKGVALLPALEQGLKKYKKQIQRHNQISFYYLAAYILFREKAYAKALPWLNLILKEKKEDVVTEIFQFSRVLNLLLHFELENYTLLNSLIPSTRRYLRTRRTIYAVEKLLFRFLQKAMSIASSRELPALIEQFKNDIHTAELQKKEARVFNYIDLLAWLKERG
ncbi:MAG: hypothetical protein AB8G15_21605 [Saprospiraceae bacterium]